MRIISGAGAWPCTALVLIGLFTSYCAAFFTSFTSFTSSTSSAFFAFSEEAVQAGHERRTLAILDPIDLHTQRSDADWGEFLRRSFSANPNWTVPARDSMNGKLKDYKVDPRMACHEFQCAFDAGNILSAEFVLFGSITGMVDLYAYTLNLVHVPTSQTVWSRVGEVRKNQAGPPAAALEATLTLISGDLGPDRFRTGRREKRGQLTVLDLSAAGSTPSRIMSERVATHLYASRNYHIMGRKEMEELLKALEIDKRAFNPTDSGIYAVGGKMDITHLVYSRLLANRNGDMQLQLALYDISSQRKLRDWPSPSTSDFRALLEFEDRFFTDLFKLPDPAGGAAKTPVSGHWSRKGVGLSLALGAVCGYFAYAADRQADREYAKFQAARSREAAVSSHDRVLDHERNATVFGILGGLGLAGAGGLLFFSF